MAQYEKTALGQQTALLPQYYIDLFSQVGAAQPYFLQSVTAENNLGDFLLMDSAFADQLLDQAAEIYRDCPELVVTTGLALHKQYTNNFFIWLMASDDVHQLIQRLHSLSTDEYIERIVAEPDKLTVVFVHDMFHDDSLIVFGLSCIIGLIKTSLPGAHVLAELASNEQKYTHFFNHHLDVELRYNQTRTQLVVHYGDLDPSSLITSNQALADLLSDSTHLREMRLQKDVVFQVQDIVRRTLHNPALSIADVAKALCMSPRTLQRKLQEKQQSFQNILNDERKSRAMRLMQDKTLDRLQVSERVGFQDIRSLYRLLNR